MKKILLLMTCVSSVFQINSMDCSKPTPDDLSARQDCAEILNTPLPQEMPTDENKLNDLHWLLIKKWFSFEYLESKMTAEQKSINRQSFYKARQDIKIQLDVVNDIKDRRKDMNEIKSLLHGLQHEECQNKINRE